MKPYVKVFEETDKIPNRKKKAMKVASRRKYKNEIEKLIKENEEIEQSIYIEERFNC